MAPYRKTATNRARLPDKVGEELDALPPRLQRYAKSILAHDGELEVVAKSAGVTHKTLVAVRREICRRMGCTSLLVRAIYSKGARDLEIDSEIRCERCGLRGHDAQHCDMPGIDFYASRRF